MEQLLAHSGHIYSCDKYTEYRLWGYLLTTEFSSPPDSFDLFWITSIYNEDYAYFYEEKLRVLNYPELYYLGNHMYLIDVTGSHLLGCTYVPAPRESDLDIDSYSGNVHDNYDDILYGYS